MQDNKSLFETFKINAYKKKYEFAIDYYGKKISYGNLLKYIEYCYNFLVKMKIEKTDKILVCLPNIPQAIISLYAINKLGAVSVFINSNCCVQTFKNAIKSNDIKAVILLENLYEKFKNHLGTALEEKTILCNGASFAPFNKKAYVKDCFYEIGRFESNSDVFDFDKLLKLNEYQSSDKANICKNEDDAVILYSGTNGIALSDFAINQNAILQSKMVSSAPMRTFVVTGDEISTISALSTMHACFMSGYCFGLIPIIEKKALKLQIAKKRPLILSSNPYFYFRIFKDMLLDKKNLSHIIGLYINGQKVENELFNRIKLYFKTRKCESEIIQCYGMTKTAGIIAVMDEKKEGFKPLKDVTIKVFDPKTYSCLPNNEVGEIVVLVPFALSRYVDDSKDDRLVDNENNIWVKTGDFGYLDDNGILHYEYSKNSQKICGVTADLKLAKQIIMENEDVIDCDITFIEEDYSFYRLKAILKCKKNADKDKISKEIVKSFIEKGSKTLVPKVLKFDETL